MTLNLPDQPGSRAGKRAVVVGGLVIALMGTGWFLLSHNVMGTAVVDALGETAGVVLALLVVASVVGAVASGGGSHR